MEIDICGRAATERIRDIASTVDGDNPGVLLMQSERSKVIADAVRGLTPEHAQLIHWRYQTGMTFEEIGDRLEVSKAAVHSMHARALKRLRTSLLLMGVRELRE